MPWTTSAATPAPCSAAGRSTGAWSPARCTSPASTCGTGGSCAGRPTTRSLCCRRGSGTDGSRCGAPSLGQGPPEPEERPMAWEAIADLAQLEEGDMMLVQLGEPICIVRLYEDEVVAIHNTCTHQQQPLNEGYLQEDDTLICPAHNSRF